MALKCKDCGTILNSYHTGLLCWPCQEKKKEQLQEQIADTPNYTVENLCFLLGYANPESVKRLGRKGKIPGRIHGIRQHLYLKEEVDQWLHGEQQKATTNAEVVPTFIQHQLEKHLDDLAQTAKILVHHCRRLLRYKDNGNVEAMGDVFSHLSFWWKPNQTILGPGEGIDPTREFRYENKHLIDPYLAKLLYIHYEGEFDKPPFKEWNQLSTENISREITDNLEYLAHGGLEPCPKCSICLQR